MEIGNARVSLFTYFKDYIIQMHGESGWHEVLSFLPEGDSEIIKSGLEGTKWLPAPLLNRLQLSYIAAFGNGNLEFIIPSTEYVVEKDLEQFFEKFNNLKNNPFFLIKSVPAIWNRYFDTGEMVVKIKDEENNRCKISIHESNDENMVSGRLICTYGVPYWLKVALTKAGAKGVEVAHTECRFSESDLCKIEVTWK